MNFDTEQFELTSDLEIDSLLTDLPFDLMKENLRDQINDPLSTTINYVNVIMEKCDIIKQDYYEHSDVLNNINSSLRNFFDFIITEIDNKYRLDIDLSDQNDKTVILIGEALYNFLILRYKKNIGRYIYTYIVRNRKSLIELLDKVPKKKDVTSISLRKKIKNKDDILIISNLPTLIKHIINLNIDALDFIRYACNDEYYEGNMIKHLIVNGNITGNFVVNYLNLLINEYDEIIDEIQTDIKLKLMKK